MSVGPVKSDQVQFETIWEPVPGLEPGMMSSQALAVSCECNVILYDGSRGPGKTDAQLMHFRRLVGKGYGKHLRGVIFDREYKNLEDLIAKSEKHFNAFFDGARLIKSQSQLKWVWPTGEQLMFRVIKKESDYWNYHGQEFPWIGWNELTKYPNRKVFDLMMSCNRSGFVPEVHTPRNRDGTYKTEDGKPLPPLPLQVFATTNPWGAGHAWVKKEFIDNCEPGEVRYTETKVFNPRTKRREIVRRSKIRIFGTYMENIYLDPVYIANLENETDPERRKAWLLGDWNIRAGGMFNDIWDERVHVIPRFKVPVNWPIDRAFDWGSSRPFSVGWYCVANGETVICEDGTAFTPARGSIIRIAEWYGTSGGENDGLRMSAPEVAEGIMRREVLLQKKGYIPRVPAPGAADVAIFSVNEKGIRSIAVAMDEVGVGWTKSDSSAGSRKNGWQLMRDMLTNAKRRSGPGLYFTSNCGHARALIPDTPRDEEDPDDVDTMAEDHLQDEVRYRVLDFARKYGGKLKVKLAA